MSKATLLATSALIIATTAAGMAQAETSPQVATAPIALSADPNAPLIDSTQQGVLVFTPDFFADQRPNTALEMVNRIPGFSVDNGSGSRGFEGAVGNILINNARPASKTDTGSNVLGRTLARQVERIELIRGGAPGIDMQGYAVVVNVIIKVENTSQTILNWNTVQFEGQGQDLYAGSVQYTASRGAHSWGLTLSDGISSSDSNGPGDQIRRDPNGTILRQERTSNDGYGGSTSMRGTYAGPLAGGTVDLTARYGIEDWHDYNVAYSDTSERDSRNDEDSHNGEFGATWKRPLSQRLNLETRLMHEFGDWDGASTYDVVQRGVVSPKQVFDYSGKWSESIARALVRQERSERLTLEVGAEVAYNMRQADQAFTVGGTPVSLPSASVKVEETRGEAFTKGTFRMRPNLTMEAGLRLEASTISQSGDANQEKSFFFAKPRLMVSWTPRTNNQLRFRFERELGQLDFSDFAASTDLDDENVYGGNTNLEPEQRWISELTYERRFWNEGIVTLTYRHDEIIDAIDSIPLADGVTGIGNIGNGTLDRLSLNFTIPMDRMGFTGGQLSFSNNWNHTRVTDPTTGDRRSISGVRSAQPAFTIQQDIDSLKTQWGFSWLPYISQPRYSPDQISYMRGTNFFEAFAEYKPTATLSIRAQLNVWDDLSYSRVVFADRANHVISYIEDSYIDPRTFFQLRVRKTF